MPGRHYCTYFDHRYLPRGIAMMKSIREWDPVARFYVLALDDKCKDILDRLGDSNILAIPLAELETQDPELLAAKPSRTLIEYYFTCSPCLPRYVLKRWGDQVPMITYIDADTLFFADPEIVYDEIGDASIAATPHRFAPERRHLVKYGVFNVGWISWRNDAEGRRCLEDYRSQCIAWCHDRLEDDRYADQKYLDKWPQTYKGFRPIMHPGVNAAAWNVNSHNFSDVDGVIFFGDKRLVFWHYHALKETPDGKWNPGLDQQIISSHPMLLDRIYSPYIQKLINIEADLKRLFQFERDTSVHIRYSADRPMADGQVKAPKPATFDGWRHAGAAWPQDTDPGWDDGQLQEVRRQQWQRLQATPDHDLLGVSAAEQFNTLIGFDAVHAARTLKSARGEAGPLRILDWGGEVGGFHYRLRRLHPDIAVDYAIKEMPPLCALGRVLNPEARFIESADEATATQYDLVIASAAIHYGDEWRQTVVRLAKAARGPILLARQPTVAQARSYVSQQGAYGTVFTCWIINEAELVAAFGEAGLKILRRSFSGDGANIAGAPEQPAFRSYLLVRP